MNQFLKKIAGMSTQIVIVAAIIITAIYYSAMYNDGSDVENRLKTVHQQLVEAQGKEKESDATIKAAESAKKAVEATREQIHVAASQVPATLEQSDLIGLVDRAARTAGLAIKTKEWRELRREGGLLEALPMRIAAEGKFVEVARFLFELIKIDRAMSIGNFSIAGPRSTRAGNNGNSALNQGKSQLELELKFYKISANKK